MPPLFNEAESLPELHAWITRVLTQSALQYEILFVDDGSDVAVHVAVDLDVLHHLAAVGFEAAVEVVEVVDAAYTPTPWSPTRPISTCPWS